MIHVAMWKLKFIEKSGFLLGEFTFESKCFHYTAANVNSLILLREVFGLKIDLTEMKNDMMYKH